MRQMQGVSIGPHPLVQGSTKTAPVRKVERTKNALYARAMLTRFPLGSGKPRGAAYNTSNCAVHPM
jgi:hypothetical protein